MLASVLFPEPFSPTSPTFSPVRSVTVIPSRMTWGPKDLWRSVAVRTGTARVIAEPGPASRRREFRARLSETGGPAGGRDAIHPRVALHGGATALLALRG